MGCGRERWCGAAEGAKRSLLPQRGYLCGGDWGLLLRRRCGAGCVARIFVMLHFFESYTTLLCACREHSCTFVQNWYRTSTHWPKWIGGCALLRWSKV